MRIKEIDWDEVVLVLMIVGLVIGCVVTMGAFILAFIVWGEEIKAWAESGMSSGVSWIIAFFEDPTSVSYSWIWEALLVVIVIYMLGAISSLQQRLGACEGRIKEADILEHRLRRTERLLGLGNSD